MPLESMRRSDEVYDDYGIEMRDVAARVENRRETTVLHSLAD